MDLRKLSDKQLIEETKAWALKEREIMTTVLHHIKEVSRRRLFCEYGYQSISEFVERELGYSQDQAWRRVSAANLLSELPELEEKLQSGALNLTHLNLGKSLFTQEKKFDKPLSRDEKLAIFDEISDTSTREAEKILLNHSSQKIEFRESVKQVAPDLFEHTFYADKELNDQIDRLKGLLAHSHPNMSTAELVKKLCEVAEKELSPAKQEVKTAAPRAARPDHVRAKARRITFKEASGQCENCGSTHFLQVDHVIPKAKQGSSEPHNLRLLCRNCNQRAAIKEFGMKKMEGYFTSG